MVSKINGAFPLLSFKRRLLLRGKCASPNFLIKNKKQKILVVRDFPEGCGPHGRYATNVLKDLGQPEVPGSAYDLVVEETMVSFDKEGLDLVASGGSVVMDLPRALDTKTAEQEITELAKNIVVQILPRVYPPRRNISVIRDFPQGCGRKTSGFSKKDAPKAIANKTSGFAHKNHASFEETIQGDTHNQIVVSTHDCNLYQSKPNTQAISNTCSQDIECFGNNTGKKPMNNMDRTLEGKLSGKCASMIQAQGKVSIDSGFPEHRVTVLGLMAAPKCLWRHGKWASRSAITRGTTQTRGNKH